MQKYLIFITLIIIIFLIILSNKKVLKINTYTTQINNINIKKEIEYKNNIVGKIEIEKIGINKNLYNDEHNNIEENITIIDDIYDKDFKSNILILAAHSGKSKISYFERLNELKLNDIVYLEYKNKYIKYKVNKIIIQNKIGSIKINKTNYNQLILTTCHPNLSDKQLIINLKEEF